MLSSRLERVVAAETNSLLRFVYIFLLEHIVSIHLFIHSTNVDRARATCVLWLTCIYLTHITGTARCMRAGPMSVGFSRCSMNACWVSEWMKLKAICETEMGPAFWAESGLQDKVFL